MLNRRAFPSFVLVVVSIVSVFAPTADAAQRRGRRPVAPRLLVVISIDQMREDVTTRYAGYLRHGLKRMRTEGFSFTEAHHDHGVTVTAAGHAALSTGCTPGQNGIVGNDWFDRTSGKQMYCTGDDSVRVVDPVPGGAMGNQSPRNLRRPALGDWLKATSPGSKVFAIAGKDRSAVLMAGKKPDGAFWYSDKTGHFVTSTFYAAATPKWLDAFNAGSHHANALKTGWVPSLEPEDYLISSEDSFASEGDCIKTTFPHAFDTDMPNGPRAIHKEVMYTPFGDEMTMDAAQQLILAEKLGTDRATDILWIGLSSADLVGHAYGPLSQETQDYFVRIDRRIGDFLGFLDERIGRSQYVVALTSDHGVMPLPEDLARRGYPSSRVLTKDFDSALSAATESAREELGLTKPLYRTSDYAGVYLDMTEASSRGLNSTDVRKRVADKLRSVAFLSDAMTWDELSAAPGPGERQYLNMYRRSFSADRSPDVMIRPKEYVLMNWRGCGTSHGTPYRFDTHVPMLYFGAGIPAGRRNERVRTIDLAPTLARIIGITPPSDIDGKALPFDSNGRN